MDRLKKFAIHLLLLSIIVTTASFAHAQEKLILPTPLKYEGLTFAVTLPTGLTLNSTPLVASIDSTLEFEPQIDKPPTEPLWASSPLPSASPMLTPLASPTPKISPTPSPAIIVTPTPIKQEPTPVTPQTGSNTTSGGLNADLLFSMSNSYRASKGLPAFETEARVCTLAAQRAPEIGAEIAEGHMHSGKNSHNTEFAFTENIISMNSEASAFNWWISDYIHRVQIEAANKYSCVACSGNSCVQEFSNL